MDWIINGVCVCVTWAVKPVWPTILSHHPRHEWKGLRARQRGNIRADLPAADNDAALLHMLSMTNRYVHWLRRGRFSLTWDKSLILSWIPPCCLTAVKWQKYAWIHSVVCGAPAGLLHWLPQSQKVPLSERKQTGEVWSKWRRVKGSAREAGLAEGKKTLAWIYLFIWFITRRPKGKFTKHKEAVEKGGIRKRATSTGKERKN